MKAMKPRTRKRWSRQRARCKRIWLESERPPKNLEKIQPMGDQATHPGWVRAIRNPSTQNPSPKIPRSRRRAAALPQ